MCSLSLIASELSSAERIKAAFSVKQKREKFAVGVLVLRNMQIGVISCSFAENGLEM